MASLGQEREAALQCVLWFHLSSPTQVSPESPNKMLLLLVPCKSPSLPLSWSSVRLLCVTRFRPVGQPSVSPKTVRALKVLSQHREKN